jgi:hypothetical protein
MKKTPHHSSMFAGRGVARSERAVAVEELEPRNLFSALPTVTLVASAPTASGITGANGQFKVTRTGSTAAPLKVYYHASDLSTLTSHQYTKLSGEVTVHMGERYDRRRYVYDRSGGE